MTFIPTYHERNLNNLANLGDSTKEKAIEWYTYLIQEKIDLLIYETIRTEAQQRENVKNGASQTMKSYHLVGQALDFVPLKGSAADWNGYGSAEVKKAVSKAKALGFEWGGDWTGFVDKPHLQYNHKGYGTDTFKTKGKAINLGEKAAEPVKEEVKSATTNNPSYPAIKKGSKGDAVKTLQTKLNKLGYTLTVDGDFGAKTETQVKLFQTKNKLVVDGIVGKNTWAKLDNKPVENVTYTLPTGTYKKGSKGTAVKQIQNALNKLNFKCGTADGIWGAKTEDALRRFQSVYCNPVDGIYGKNTRAAMLKQLNK